MVELINAPDMLLEKLLIATATGDRKAFAELYRLTAPRLYGLALRMTGSPVEAAEALQESFVRIWSSAARFNPARGAAIHWLTAVTRNATIDHLRKQHAADLSLDDITDLPAPNESAFTSDIWKALSTLTPDQRRVILLGFYFGFSHTEVSRRLKVPLGTVKSWTRRGLIKIKAYLTKPD